MRDLKANDLIQAKVLGCLDPDEEAAFSKLMEEDQEFPWEEFGRYQNLVSHLPILLDAEIPDQEVKDSIARKLLELSEQKKAEEIVYETPEVVEDEKFQAIDTSEDEGVIVEEDNIELDIPNDISFEEKESKKGISFKEHGVLQNALGDSVRQKSQTTARQEEKTDKSTESVQPPNDIDRTNVRSHVSKSPVFIEPTSQTGKNNGTITAIILFVIALIALIVVYFKLSSDIQNNKDEIERLKEQIFSSNAVENSYLNNRNIS